MRSQPYVLVSGILFGLVALLHLLRLAKSWAFQLGPWHLPMWVSWLGAVGPGLLCLWAFYLAVTDR